MLLLLAHLYSGLPTPTSSDLEEIHDSLTIKFLPSDMMEREVCGHVGACDGTNLAAYELGTNHIIVTEDCLDMENNPYCQAVVLHEMVHFLQYINGKYRSLEYGSLAEIKYCSKLIENEAEAYTIQRKFLENQGIDVSWTVSDALKNYSCNIKE